MRFAVIGWRGALAASALLTGFLVPLGSAMAWHESVLHSFCSQASCADGAVPGAVVYQSGTLFGLTGYGAKKACLGGSAGCGVVYSLVPGGTEKVLHTFCSEKNCTDGALARSLVADSSGNLYGTASEGGSNDYGMVYELSTQGTETVLYQFCSQSNCTDGSYPVALIADGAGNFYGTTGAGGSPLQGLCEGGCGTIFKLAADGTESVLYSFCSVANCTDGFEANSLIFDTAGNLYGTTMYGGGGGCADLPYGCGTVFKLSPDGTETVLHAFTGGSDGSVPGGLILDNEGNLYGAANGGGNSNCGNGYGCGVVFKLAPDGTETVLYSFTGGSDGAFPSGLLAAGGGYFIGTAEEGGDLGCSEFPAGCGTVFKLSPDGTEKVLYTFKGPNDDGSGPGGLIADGTGLLYGVTAFGGHGGGGRRGCFYKQAKCGTVFELKKE